MKADKFNQNALSNHIAEHITEQIIKGELVPGDKLIEHIYAEEYGTSRAPVREAIYLLSIEGLVERIPRKGAVVKDYTENEIYDLLEIRIMLESMAMDRISRNGIDEHELKKMKELLDKMNDVTDVHQYTLLNHSFHTALVEMSKSETIKTMYSRLGWPLLRIQSLSFASQGNIEKSVREHELLIGLLKDGKLDEAAELLTRHNQDVIASMKRKMGKREGMQ
ncbi:DNA-binding GntR family transcriptional regulator [Cytobacillus firmus]|uniref:DNA-binding GntR family transcriptional regulator n=2 Tax=Cytobacillus TaxID=2675230 RepID=A0A366K3D6_CYTFI|nr:MULTISPECIES: GntR family transcriptional regulator [Cytobacillus]RBP96184.1 DNA-binding GntR family transcriptional regulator [Cytobacillus firmus]TDX45097.1 DNA-binding GntR family transcriptional regulator [Cytobacillus oceanisediminis]